MKKKLWTIFLTILALLCLTLGLTACGGGGGSGTFKTEGTYYLVEHDEYDMDTYFTLKGGKWTDDDGVSGDYEIKGENITLYSDLFGSKMVFTSGTVKGGILTLGGVYGDKVYAQKGAWSSSGSSSSGNQGSGSQTPSAKEYTVTYDANGGAFADGEKTFTQKVKDGNKLTAPASPTRSNYTFAGWAKSKNGSTMWKFDEDTVSENTTLFAQWTQESAVILSVDGASIEDRDIFMLVDHTTGEVSLSNKVVCSDDSIWRLYSDPEGQREIPTKMVTNLKNGDNTYYIVVNSQNQAQVNVYKLTVHRSYLVTVSYYNGETLLTTKEAYTGDTFTASYRPDITGYTFNKWKTAKGAEFTSDVLWGSLALYADKTANTYKVTFDVNGGDALTVTEKQVTYDSSFSLPVPKRTGYSFTGWYVGSTQVTNTNGSGLKAWNYGSGKEVTAHWQANDYAVTLKQNDEEAGTVSGGGDHAYDSQVTITATTNTGYNFLGWYDKDGELVSENAKYTFKMGFAVSYTAKWDYYTLTTARNDATAGTLSKTYSEEKISVGTKVTLKAITNKGYTWVGWYKGDDEVSKELTYQYTMTKENVTLEARWSKVTLSVNDSNAGSVKQLTDTYKVGDEVTLTATTNVGYTWVGWYKGEEEVSKDLTYQYTMTKENVTLEARWSKVTVSTNNGDACSVTELTDTYKVGDEVTLTATTNLGYTWVGWYKGDDEVSKELTYQYTMTKENVTLEARWTLDPAMADFKFSSTPTTCTITGVNDKSKIEYMIPDYVTEVKGGAFSGCNKLTSITIPFVGNGSDKTFLGYIFGASSSSYNDSYVPTSLKEVIITGRTSIGAEAFCGCSGLTSITIPDTVTSIGEAAFSGCSSLTSITIPDSVTSIGQAAFSVCSSLTSITIPDSVTSIGRYAFVGTAYYDDESHWDDSGVLYIGNHLIEAKDTISGTYTFRTGTKTIADYAFVYCEELTSIIIPDSVTSIGEYAFEDCNGLTSVTIGSGVTSIGQDAFRSCRGLTNVTIGSSVTSIGEYAFYGCWGLEHITVAKGNKVYRSEQECLIKIETKTLVLGCKNSIIPDSVTSIGEYAFYLCSGLTSITIPKSVTSIGDYAFAWCKGLTSITIPDSVILIGSGAFYECRELKSIEISDSVTSIGGSAFYDCNGLTSIIIPKSVTSIGGYAFAGCSELTDIQFHGTVREWQDIGKGRDWDLATGDYTITCTDGTIDKWGNVTHFE